MEILEAFDLTRCSWSAGQLAGCDWAASTSFAEIPDGESLHWRLYKGLFRTIDRLAGGGEMVMAAGRRSGWRSDGRRLGER